MHGVEIPIEIHNGSKSHLVPLTTKAPRNNGTKTDGDTNGTKDGIKTDGRIQNERHQ